MQAVLMSIKAGYVGYIQTGYKTVEIRRTRPARNDNFIVFIYIFDEFVKALSKYIEPDVVTIRQSDWVLESL